MKPVDQTYKNDKMVTLKEAIKKEIRSILLEKKGKDLDGDGDSDLILSFGDVAEDRETEVFYRPVILENMGDGTLKKYEISSGTNNYSTIT